MPPKRLTTEDAEDIELRWKLAQAEEIEERLAERRQRKDQITELRKRQLEDFSKAQADNARKQRVCRHRVADSKRRSASPAGSTSLPSASGDRRPKASCAPTTTRSRSQRDTPRPAPPRFRC